MSSIEYLSLSKPMRAVYKFLNFFASIGRWFANFFGHFPAWMTRLGHKLAAPFLVLWDALIKGDWITRVNFVISGFAQLFRHSIIRGLLFMAYEIAFVCYMIFSGYKWIGALGNLGSVQHFNSKILDETIGTEVSLPNYFDSSFNILLYSLFTFVFIIIAVTLWYYSIRDAKSLQDNQNVGIFASDREFLKSMGDSKYHHVLLAIPLAGLVIFTVVPTAFMIIIGFTNYDEPGHIRTTRLFDWVGWYNYQSLFGGTGTVGGNSHVFLDTFLKVLLWTLIWAVFATFSNYFLGMFAAILINMKGIKLKKLWRTILVTTIAIPQFVSLLVISKMFDREGFINSILTQWAGKDVTVQWFTDPWIAKIMVIVINMWVGIPYTMLSCTGILMNIPADLYESARIDGASPAKMFQKITLPYMMFVTGPSLISQFVGNINNFNIIYLLSGGGPTFGGEVVAEVGEVGQTDLLITWIYKMTLGNGQQRNYGYASVVGVMVFIVVAIFSLATYNNSSAVKNEEDFQ